MSGRLKRADKVHAGEFRRIPILGHDRCQPALPGCRPTQEDARKVSNYLLKTSTSGLRFEAALKKAVANHRIGEEKLPALKLLFTGPTPDFRALPAAVKDKVRRAAHKWGIAWEMAAFAEAMRESPAARQSKAEIREAASLRSDLESFRLGKRGAGEVMARVGGFGDNIGMSLARRLKEGGVSIPSVIAYRFTYPELFKILRVDPAVRPDIFKTIKFLSSQGVILHEARRLAVLAPFDSAGALERAEKVLELRPTLGKSEAILFALNYADPEAELARCGEYAHRLKPFGIVAKDDVYSIAANHPRHAKEIFSALEKAGMNGFAGDAEGQAAGGSRFRGRHVFSVAARILAESPYFDLTEALHFASRPYGIERARLLHYVMEEAPAWSEKECKLVAFVQPLRWREVIREAECAKKENPFLSDFDCKRLAILHVDEWRDRLFEEAKRIGRRHPSFTESRCRKLAVKRDRRAIYEITGRSAEERAIIKVNNQNHRAVEAGAKGSHTVGEWLEVRDKAEGMCPGWNRHPHYVGETELTQDHVLSFVRGGTNYIENIQPLCSPCNTCKGHEPGWAEIFRRLAKGVPADKIASSPEELVESLKHFAEANRLPDVESLKGVKSYRKSTCTRE